MDVAGMKQSFLGTAMAGGWRGIERTATAGAAGAAWMAPVLDVAASGRAETAASEGTA